MPFTFAHPAAVLPIHAKLKRWISLPALAIGAMVPDAAYYLPLPWYYKSHAHSFLGAFSFDLPLGIAVLLIFYWVAPEFVYLLPVPHRAALQAGLPDPTETKSRRSPVLQALLAVCAILIGAETHILWDSSTHETGWIVLHVPLLQIRLWKTEHLLFWRGGVFVFDALEWLSSIVGLCIVLYFVDRWMKARGLRVWTRPQPSWRLYLWAGVVAASFAEAVIESHTVAALATLQFLRPHHLHFALLLVTDFIRDVLLALIVLPIGVKLLRLWPSLRDAAY